MNCKSKFRGKLKGFDGLFLLLSWILFQSGGLDCLNDFIRMGTSRQSSRRFAHLYEICRRVGSRCKVEKLSFLGQFRHIEFKIYSFQILIFRWL